MADNGIIELSKALVLDLNTTSRWSLQFSAERKYKPDPALTETNNLTVQVAMKAWRTSPDNRTDWSHEYDIDIGFLFRADPKQGEQAVDAFDKVVLLVQEVADYYSTAGTRIDNCKLIASAFGATGDAPYHPDHIESLNQITSILTLTFWKLRDPSA